MLNIAVTAKIYPVDEKFTLSIGIKTKLYINNHQTWRVVLFQRMKKSYRDPLTNQYQNI